MSERILRCLLLGGLACVLLASPVFAQPDGPPRSAAEAIGRCFALRDSEPAAAAALANAYLATPGLTVADEIKLQLCLSRSAALAGQTDTAFTALGRVEVLLASHPMPPEFLVRAYSNVGATLHTLGRIHSAIDHYVKAYQVAPPADAEETQISMLMNVGIIHSDELGAYARAEEFYAQAQALQDTLDEPRPLLQYLHALNMLRMDRAADALALFTETEKQAASAGEAMFERRARAERLALQARGRPVPAGELLRIAGQQQAAHDPSGAALTLLRLSGLALAAGAPGDALRHARAAIAALDGSGFDTERRDAMIAAMAAQRALGHWSQAFAASEFLRKLQVDRLRAQNMEGLAGLQARLQDAQAERELARMRAEGSQRERELRESRWLRNASIAALLLLSLLGAGFLLYHRRVTRRLHRLGTTDALTGLLNRGAAAERMDRFGRMAPEPGAQSAVLLVDVDDFKAHNDRHGHIAGDQALARVAQRIRDCCRTEDVVARWGGEEFMVFAPNMDLAGASALAECIRTAVASMSPAPVDPASGTRLTVSVGLAPVPFYPSQAKGGDWQASVRLADRALYAAKHSGRDAWIALWGRHDGEASLDTVLADPAAAEAAGEVEIVASRQPVRWRDSVGSSHG